MMVIVKEPRVDVSLAQRGLYGGKIHGQITILNNGRVLSELSPCARQLMRGAQNYGRARIFFRVAAGSVSQAVRNTSLGARPRMRSKYGTARFASALAVSR